MRKLRFEVAYDGTDFNGWQVQPGLPTIQSTLEEVIGSIEGRAVHVIGSGRTDAGVHALAQVAAVCLNNPIPAENFRRAVNRLLPYTIRIKNVAEVDMTFHPRFDASRKTYQYRIVREEVCSPFERRFVYHHPYPLDEAAMTRTALLFEGEHDFTSFASSDDKDSPTASRVRSVFYAGLCRQGHLLVFTITGSGFLKHMVRNMMGVLIEVGKGNLSKSDILARFDPANRIAPGPAVPAGGLFLMSVEYREK